MRYDVQWKPTAQQQLAHLWIDAVDKDAVTTAADTVDSALERDPDNLGESRSGVNRVVFEGPLGFSFDVDPVQRTVVVLWVWRPR
jgi:hypothetical protein